VEGNKKRYPMLHFLCRYNTKENKKYFDNIFKVNIIYTIARTQLAEKPQGSENF